MEKVTYGEAMCLEQRHPSGTVRAEQLGPGAALGWGVQLPTEGRWGCVEDGIPPIPSKGEGRAPQHQLVLCSAEWAGRFCRVKSAVARSDARWHAENQVMLPMVCENLGKINFPSEPSSGETFNQNAEFKSHSMRRSEKEKLSTFSAKTQCFEWSSQEVRSKL